MVQQFSGQAQNKIGLLQAKQLLAYYGGEKALTEKHKEENNEKEDAARLCCGSGSGWRHIVAGTGAWLLAAWLNWALHFR